MWDMKTGRSRGYGFVAFRDRGDAEKALSSMDGEWLGSRAIRCNWANQKGQPSISQQQAMSSMGMTPTTPYGHHHFPTHGMHSYEMVVAQTPQWQTTCYVGNLTPYTTQNDLIPLFQNFGFVAETRFQSDRGFAFVKMDTHENAAMAICQLSGYNVNGRPLKCSVSNRHLYFMRLTDFYLVGQRSSSNGPIRWLLPSTTSDTKLLPGFTCIWFPAVWRSSSHDASRWTTLCRPHVRLSTTAVPYGSSESCRSWQLELHCATGTWHGPSRIRPDAKQRGRCSRQCWWIRPRGPDARWLWWPSKCWWISSQWSTRQLRWLPGLMRQPAPTRPNPNRWPFVSCFFSPTSLPEHYTTTILPTTAGLLESTPPGPEYIRLALMACMHVPPWPYLIVPSDLNQLI